MEIKERKNQSRSRKKVVKKLSPFQFEGKGNNGLMPPVSRLHAQAFRRTMTSKGNVFEESRFVKPLPDFSGSFVISIVKGMGLCGKYCSRGRPDFDFLQAGHEISKSLDYETDTWIMPI